MSGEREDGATGAGGGAAAPPCPKCGAPMELKKDADPLAALIGGNTLVIWQCQSCKNIEVA